MPKRDRNHELETESQRAFEAAMPSSLVARPVSDDYGVDREVEVFDNGKTTGLTFKVQLKGTDKSGSTRRVKRDHLTYWNSLDVPVLLVSYEAPTRVLRARWVHSIGMDAPDTGAQTVTVHMDSDIDLAGDWADGLVDDLHVIRAVRRRDLPNPMPIRIQIDEGATAVSPLHATGALLRASRETSHPMSDAGAVDVPALTFHLAERRVTCALPLGLASSTLHIELGMLQDITPAVVADLCMALAAGAIASTDDQTARAWALAVDPESPLWGVEALGERLLPVLAHPESAGALLNVHRARITDNDPIGDMYLAPLLDLAPAIPEDEFIECSDTIRAAIKATVDGGRRIHNLAQLHKARGDYETAAALLVEAGTLAIGYRTNPRYLRHLGACEWELGRYDDAAAHYAEARTHGYDPNELLPLLADALMHAGHYAQARQALNEWAPVGHRDDRLGILRQIMLDHLHNLGFVDQERANPERAFELVDDGLTLKAGVTNDDLLDVLRSTDALNPIPWILIIDADDPAGSFEAALIAAVLTVHFAHG
jgi:tetratricopeptide (TPR) repeat protein